MLKTRKKRRNNQGRKNLPEKLFGNIEDFPGRPEDPGNSRKIFRKYSVSGKVENPGKREVLDAVINFGRKLKRTSGRVIILVRYEVAKQSWNEDRTYRDRDETS